MTATGRVSDYADYTSDRNGFINGMALAYTIGGYGVAIALLTAQSWLWNGIGFVLLVHTLMWAAYFVHEFIHGTIFRKMSWNEAFGHMMLFLTGSCYCRYKNLARSHLAHHKNRADFSPFSIPDFLKSLPKPLRQAIVVLEWCYVPALNFLLRWMSALTPFLGDCRKAERTRNAMLMLIRGSFFAVLAVYSPKALILYFLAYICFINILRFLDCFQHTYTVFRWGDTVPPYDLEHEEVNTFSNILSKRHPWLNLIFLNFGYHNAHHRVVRCPWYRLPQLHAELYPDPYRQEVTLPMLLRNYHRYRIRRLFGGQGEVGDRPDGTIDIQHFVGGIGVSFLILREPLDWLPSN